jgi:hypothetical protein
MFPRLQCPEVSLPIAYPPGSLEGAPAWFVPVLTLLDLFEGPLTFLKQKAPS